MQYGAMLNPVSDADGTADPASGALANNDAFASTFTGGTIDPAGDDNAEEVVEDEETAADE